MAALLLVFAVPAWAMSTFNEVPNDALLVQQTVASIDLPLLKGATAGISFMVIGSLVVAITFSRRFRPSRQSA